jgi:site-specific DNA-methyltransferase (adenine-specific)
MKLKIEYVDINSIKPYKNNAKLHPEEQIEQIKKSIEEFGMDDPIGIWKDEIVEGHGRLIACKELGMTEVPIIRLDHLTDEERKAYTLAHNKLTMNSDFDLDILNDELMNFDTIDMSDFGFDLDLEDEEEKEIIEDEVPEVPEEPKAKLGDIYQLGNHRLMCGDSTSEEDVNKLLNGNNIELLMTDPPYNFQYGGQGFINENKTNVKERIKNIIDFDATSISFLINMEIKNLFFFTSKDLIEQYFEIFKNYKKNILVWEKTNCPPMTNNTFLPDIEYLLYFYKEGRIWNNGITPIDAYRKCFISSTSQGKIEAGGDVHPTIKPQQLLIDKIKICSNEKGNVLDLFGGSGSTLIACEQTNRKCYMMELDPHYIDVIIQRWENFTGEKAVLLNRKENE